MLESQVSYIVKSQVQEWEVSAGVVLQHFRCVLRGFLPFQLARDNLSELIAQAKLDPTSAHYVVRIVLLLDQERKSFTFPLEYTFASLKNSNFLELQGIPWPRSSS
jgi:hypothetical protein